MITYIILSVMALFLLVSAFKRRKVSDLVCLMLVLVPLALRALHIK
jgi:hypothetical protein